MPSPLYTRLTLHCLSCTLLALALNGCATADSSTASENRSSVFPELISSRWTPPAFATRPVTGETATVLDACVKTANALGYSVSRFDGARGRISATRRQTALFDSAREDTLEITVTVLAPGTSQVALVLRETTETSGSDRAAPTAAASLVRDRGRYDTFFARLEAALRPADTAR
ncbi:MAG: hypothetical protein NTU80_03690 [Verrucomicrobia bacterium]|nr:hypothetical protein [Verrucomicrobiota bacterium]